LVIALEMEREQQRPIDLSKAEAQEQLQTRLTREWRHWIKGRRGRSLDAKKAGRVGQELAAPVDAIPAPMHCDPLSPSAVAVLACGAAIGQKRFVGGVVRTAAVHCVSW